MLRLVSENLYLVSKKAKPFKYIIGVDEAGRGPLAGPVVASACMFLDRSVHIDGICDSKLTSEEERPEIYDSIINSNGSIWATSVITHKEIDDINILQATMKGMKSAIEEVLRKGIKEHQIDPNEVLVLVDGNRIPENLDVEAQAVVKGDSKVYSIACASILAKVTRDKIMIEYDKEFPDYGFAKHKGYPTVEHRRILSEIGPCFIHRSTYGPVRDAISKHDTIMEKRFKIEKRTRPVSFPVSSTPEEPERRRRVLRSMTRRSKAESSS